MLNHFDNDIHEIETGFEPLSEEELLEMDLEETTIREEMETWKEKYQKLIDSVQDQITEFDVYSDLVEEDKEKLENLNDELTIENEKIREESQNLIAQTEYLKSANFDLKDRIKKIGIDILMSYCPESKYPIKSTYRNILEVYDQRIKNSQSTPSDNVSGSYRLMKLLLNYKVHTNVSNYGMDLAEAIDNQSKLIRERGDEQSHLGCLCIW